MRLTPVLGSRCDAFMTRLETPRLVEEAAEDVPEAAAAAAGRVGEGEGGGVKALPRGERVTVISRSCADRDMLVAVEVVAAVAVVDDAAVAPVDPVIAVARLLSLNGAADDQPSQLRGPDATAAAAAAAAVENVEGAMAWEPLRLCLLWESWW